MLRRSSEQRGSNHVLPTTAGGGEGRVVIRLRGITKIYRMGVETIAALNGVDLDIRENEFVAIMGPSGSGKSTMMNILGCLDRPTEGRYELDGIDTTKMTSGRLAGVRNERIGFVFQSFELMPRASAVKNVEMPLVYSNVGWASRRRRAKAVLQRVGLGQRMSHRPNQLSGGQKQRVAIARALVNEPAILLADEPTGNLDSRTTTEILRLFEQLHHEGQTIVIVTHEEDVASHCQRIVRMSDGVVVSDLPTAEDPINRQARHRPELTGQAGEDVRPADVSAANNGDRAPDPAAPSIQAVRGEADGVIVRPSSAARIAAGGD